MTWAKETLNCCTRCLKSKSCITGTSEQVKPVFRCDTWTWTWLTSWSGLRVAIETKFAFVTIFPSCVVLTLLRINVESKQRCVKVSMALSLKLLKRMRVDEICKIFCKREFASHPPAKREQELTGYYLAWQKSCINHLNIDVNHNYGSRIA